MQHNAAFFQGLHCLLGKKLSSGEEILITFCLKSLSFGSKENSTESAECASFLYRVCKFSVQSVQVFCTECASFLYRVCKFSVQSVQVFCTECASFLCQTN